MQRRSKISEKLAKEILERVFPERYGILECRDTPDLQDNVNNIGVEVVRAYDERSFEADGLSNKVFGSHKKHLKSKDKKKMDKLESEGYSFGEFEGHGIAAVSSPAFWSDNEHILREVKTKIDKLNRENDRYADFNDYHLFVYGDVLETIPVFGVNKNGKVSARIIDEIGETAKKIMEYQNEKSRQFSTLYFKDMDLLYEIDLTKGEWMKHCISNYPPYSTIRDGR